MPDKQDTAVAIIVEIQKSLRAYGVACFQAIAHSHIQISSV